MGNGALEPEASEVERTKLRMDGEECCKQERQKQKKRERAEERQEG